MSQVKYKSAQALADALAPYLNDIPLYVTQQDWEIDQPFPAVVILPGKHIFMPWITREINTSDTRKMLSHVGDWEGSTDIRIYSKKSPERDRIEQVITEFFMSRENCPGTIICSVDSTNYGGVGWIDKSFASYSLDDADWREEMVFTDSRFSFLTLTSTYMMYASSNTPDLRIQLNLEINEYLEDIVNIS